MTPANSAMSLLLGVCVRLSARACVTSAWTNFARRASRVIPVLTRPRMYRLPNLELRDDLQFFGFMSYVLAFCEGNVELDSSAFFFFFTGEFYRQMSASITATVVQNRSKVDLGPIYFTYVNSKMQPSLPESRQSKTHQDVNTSLWKGNCSPFVISQICANH